jgi:hypothetical protein
MIVFLPFFVLVSLLCLIKMCDIVLGRGSAALRRLRVGSVALERLRNTAIYCQSSAYCFHLTFLNDTASEDTEDRERDKKYGSEAAECVHSSQAEKCLKMFPFHMRWYPLEACILPVKTVSPSFVSDD